MENKSVFKINYDRREVTYKEQGDRSDSWLVVYYLGDEVVGKEMVYKDPDKPDNEQTEKIIETITPDLLISLWDKMIENLTPEQVGKLKQKLK